MCASLFLLLSLSLCGAASCFMWVIGVLSEHVAFPPPKAGGCLSILTAITTVFSSLLTWKVGGQIAFNQRTLTPWQRSECRCQLTCCIDTWSDLRTATSASTSNGFRGLLHPGVAKTSSVDRYIRSIFFCSCILFIYHGLKCIPVNSLALNFLLIKQVNVVCRPCMFGRPERVKQIPISLRSVLSFKNLFL